MILSKIFTDDDKNKNNTSHTGQKGQETLNNKNKTQNTMGGSNAQGPFGGATGSESGYYRCKPNI